MLMEFKENSKPKKSILHTFLSKRSTKVEPHPFDDRHASSSYHRQSSTSSSHEHQHQPFQQASVSAHSTPIKRFHKIAKLNKLWQCHSSNQSLASNHSAPSYFLRKTSNHSKSKIRNTTDRHSHPISTNTVSFLDRSTEIHDDPNRSECCVYYSKQDNNLVDAATNQQEKRAANQNRRDQNLNKDAITSAQFSTDRFGGAISTHGVTATKSQEHICLEDGIDEFIDCDSTSPQKSPTSKSHEGFFIGNRVDHDRPFGYSIAMSACRSRLRERLLPPGYETLKSSNDQPLAPPPTHQQHFSFPNIAERNSARAPSETRKSRSFSCDLLANAKRTGRAESLAKNALMAAQLINLIPTEVARERSYLANNLAFNSLLGPVELDRVLPLREIKVFVGTWNMNGQHPPKQMNDFVFPAGVEHVPDLVVIGTQESCSERFEWEVILQETLGPSHVLLHATSLGTLHLAVFLRRDLIWFCSIPEDDCLSVRPGTAFRTKGAVAISFCLFGTSMLFVTSHLTAHQQKVKERVSDVKRIIHSLDLPKNLHLRSKNKDVTQNFDAVFWCGDLNFRLGEPREKLLKWIENTQFPLPSHLPHGYMHTDQLKSCLANGAAFKDFKEANITFPPTYKYDPGTQKFDTSSKQRAPAYTDRILYKYKSNPFGLRRESNLTSFLHSATIECISYDSVPSIVSSDHKPVWALFKCCIKPGIDSIPLAAGLFNREVYIEGMKRRLTKKTTESSNACCIQ